MSPTKQALDENEKSSSSAALVPMANTLLNRYENILSCIIT